MAGLSTQPLSSLSDPLSFGGLVLFREDNRGRTRKGVNTSLSGVLSLLGHTSVGPDYVVSKRSEAPWWHRVGDSVWNVLLDAGVLREWSTTTGVGRDAIPPQARTL